MVADERMVVRERMILVADVVAVVGFDSVFAMDDAAVCSGGATDAYATYS